MKRRKAINPKYYSTKTLKSFRDNNYTGIDGLDREQYKDEIDDLYFERTNKDLERSIQELIDYLDEHDDEIPPPFNFTWCPVTETYLEWVL
jgi:hypothetical protein